MPNIFQRVGLLSYRGPLPPDEDFPNDNYYEVPGILPMLWQWSKQVSDTASYDLGLTVDTLADDHDWIHRLTGRGLTGRQRNATERPSS